MTASLLARLNPELAFYEAVYDVLVDLAGAHPGEKQDFVQRSQTPGVLEWRFRGSLGFGGKFWRHAEGFYVTCYPEDVTPARTEVITRTNAALAALVASLPIRVWYERTNEPPTRADWLIAADSSDTAVVTALRSACPHYGYEALDRYPGRPYGAVVVRAHATEADPMPRVMQNLQAAGYTVKIIERPAS